MLQETIYLKFIMLLNVKILVRYILILIDFGSSMFVNAGTIVLVNIVFIYLLMSDKNEKR